MAQSTSFNDLSQAEAQPRLWVLIVALRLCGKAKPFRKSGGRAACQRYDITTRR
jgi:hypothetical protein